MGTGHTQLSDLASSGQSHARAAAVSMMACSWADRIKGVICASDLTDAQDGQLVSTGRTLMASTSLNSSKKSPAAAIKSAAMNPSWYAVRA